ncbi:MAG: protein kinase [Planctomycetota bacterium]
MIRPNEPPSTRELFERSLELPEDQRESYLLNACPDDPGRRRRVLELLTADQRAESYFEAKRAPSPIPESSLVGKRVGNFTFERSLGSGGMGTVYEAQQHEPRRRVAIKLVHAAFLGSDITARFRREAAVLAHLEHACIARLYESGTLEIAGDTVPFLALELVENARPITDWSQETGADLKSRLRVFAQICRAIHFGHQRGIIHRDIKPDNLLVDDQDRPHVIDFGIARALDTEEGFGTMLTGSGHLIGTPRYMSPEQLRGDVDAIDFRTDVYSLGLVLFELLTGQPCRPDRISSLREIAEMVEKHEPPSVTKHQATLRGDLDVIVRRALEPDVERRYGSAAQLGREIERYLAGEPIEAKRDHSWYVLKKKLRRHRVALSIAGLIFVILTASVIGLTILWQDAQTAREDSEQRLYLSQIGAARNALEVRNIAELKQTLEECDPRFRDWEWGHLMARSDDSIATLVHGDGYARDVDFSGDGRWLASCGEVQGLHTIRIWRTDRFELEREIVVGNHLVDDIDFLPDSSAIACSSRDGTARIYSLGGEEVKRFEHDQEVFSVLVTPDGSRIAVGELQGAITVWDMRSGGRLNRLTGHHGYIAELAYSPDRDLLASGGWDRTIRLWKLGEGRLVQTITEAMDRARPGLPKVPAHAAIVTGLTFVAGGQFLLSASEDGVGKMWDAETGQLQHYEKYLRPIADLKVSPDGTLVAAMCSDSVALTSAVNARPFPPLLGHTSHLIAGSFSPDGRYLASTDRSGRVKVFEVAHRRGGDRFGGRHKVRVEALDLSRDGRTLVSGDAQGVLQMYDTGTLKLQGEFPTHQSRIRDIALDPGARRIATGADDRRLRVWDLETKERLLDEPIGYRPQIAWTRSSLVTTGEDGKLTIRDPETFEILEQVELEDRSRISLAVSEPLGLIATVGKSGNVRLWRLEDGKALREWACGAQVVQFQDGILITSGTDTRLWDPRSGDSLLQLSGQRYGSIRSLLLSDDRVATLGMRGGGPTIWDRNSGRIILELLGHDRHRILTDMLQLPDGSLVTSDDNGAIRVWRSMGRQ